MAYWLSKALVTYRTNTSTEHRSIKFYRGANIFTFHLSRIMPASICVSIKNNARHFFDTRTIYQLDTQMARCDMNKNSFTVLHFITRKQDKQTRQAYDRHNRIPSPTRGIFQSANRKKNPFNKTSRAMCRWRMWSAYV